jgi:hypothetical protein
VGVLVNDDAGFEAAVTLGRGSRPDEHLHATGLAVGGSGEFSVVGTFTILGVQDDEIVA